MQVTVYWAMSLSLPHAHQADILGSGRSAVTSVTVDLDTPAGSAGAGDTALLEALFHATNMAEGPYWQVIEPVLPPDRTHTSLSVGDYVAVEDRVYRCAFFGWDRVDAPPDASGAIGR